jgi:endoglucanase
MNRRQFLGVAGTGMLASHMAFSKDQPGEDITAVSIPRWRGFNLPPPRSGKFREEDFALMAEWGFDFARLPMSYWLWARPDDWLNINEKALEEIDQAVEWGRQYGVHVNLNFHRIPGYCVNGREREPHDLFEGPEEGRLKALEAACHHWTVFARRYRGIPNRRVSFDLMNEPPFMQDQEPYVEVVRALVHAIREIDPMRLIVADGLDIGQTPVMGIVDLGLVQSTRGYLPKAVSHYTATWVPKNEFESFAIPAWPLTDDRGRVWNRETLKAELIDKWRPLMDKGVQVHVGEWGCFNQTPHAVALAWMSDLLSLWKEAGWGFAMWNLVGNFGILNSGRQDVFYEDFKGYKLDRKMLELMRSS